MGYGDAAGPHRFCTKMMRFRAFVRRPAPLGAVVAVVGAGGLAVLVIAVVVAPPRPARTTLVTGLVLLALCITLEAMFTRIRNVNDSSETVTILEAGLVAAIVLLPPTEALILTGLSSLVAFPFSARPLLLIKVVFNFGMNLLMASAAIAVFHLGSGGDFAATAGAVALLAGMVALALTNHILMAAVFACLQKSSLGRAFGSDWTGTFQSFAASSIGLIGVWMYQTRPVYLVLVASPALALHLAFRYALRASAVADRLHREKATVDRVVEHATEGIVLADADGTVRLWSPSMERITQISGADAIGGPIERVLCGVDADGAPVEFGPMSGPMKMLVRRSDGADRWLDLQPGGEVDSDGRREFVVLMVNDITKAREADRLQEDFIARVSHELRTPLTPISAYASMLATGGDSLPPEVRREGLDTIVRRTNELGRLIEDLLLVAQLDSPGRAEQMHVASPVAMAGVARLAADSFNATLVSPIVIEATADVVALGDGGRCLQIVGQLLDNAIKHGGGGPVTIMVWGAADHACLAVVDGGQGIPADRRDVVFERFARLEDPLTMSTGGTGLGLFIARRLAQEMGGDIKLSETPGGGATFTLHLPAASLQEAGVHPGLGRPA